MSERFTAEVSAVQVESAAGRYTFRGVASTIGNVDRAGRVFLLGAFGSKTIKVPLLFQHDDKQPIGSSVLTPKGGELLHESSLNPRVAKSAEVQALIEDGDIMSTSISWLGDHYYGWTQLQREAPEMAKQAASMGIPKLENVMYCSRAQIVENSVVPIPANERALIEMRAMVESKLQVASLARASTYHFNGIREIAAGARHSSTDQGLIQAAHDALQNLGAVCPLPTGADALDSDADDSAIPAPDRTGLKGGWADDIRTPENSSVALQLLNGVDTQVVPPDPIDDLDRELAKLEAELPGPTHSPKKET